MSSFWRPVKTFILQDSCLDEGGKWASNGDYCIRPDCARSGGCLPSYNNNAICKGLPSGLTRDELFFHLGMPVHTDGRSYTFAAGGAESPITAVIVNGAVTELNCNVPANYN